MHRKHMANLTWSLTNYNTCSTVAVATQIRQTERSVYDTNNKKCKIKSTINVTSKNGWRAFDGIRTFLPAAKLVGQAQQLFSAY